MAEAAVISVLKKLADVAVHKAPELYGVIDQIKPVQRDLEFIQAILEDSDSKQHKNEAAKVWVNQVRELAYRIEGVMDTFLVEIGCFSKVWMAAKHPMKVNTLSCELKEIREEMNRIFKIRTQLGITDLGSGSEEPATKLPFRPTKPFHIDDSEVVGFDSDKNKIISQLLDKSISRRTVLSIVGVGGLGKTTLAQKVYKSAELNAEFTCRAWLSISQNFNENKVCRDILYSVEPTIKGKNISDEEVWEELAKSLSGRRYLIILDDVWTADLWKRLKVALPDTKNKSRVIITTRNLDVALAADRNTKPYELNCLNEDDSLALLFKKALQQDIELGKYPPNLVEVAKQLIEKCGRLPLALVVLGSLLSTKPDTSSAWTKVHDTLDWHSDQGKKCMQILRLSYQELCYEQKQRFLYFAAFPVDHKISAKHITKMWIAEGLISVDGEGTLENRAEDYLEDLVKRCLVQVVQKSWNGYCKYCRLHDLLRDLVIHEAKQENFFTVLSKHGDERQLANKETHRAALQFDIPTRYSIHLTNIRSLLCFRCVLNCQGFTQLRVLVMEGIDFTDINVGKNWLEGLVHTKYLGLRDCYNMGKTLENTSFNSMKNLEIFDCKFSVLENTNNLSLWEVPTLRHVMIDYANELSFPIKWDNLKNLQTLKWVSLKAEDIPNLEIESKVNIRTLKIFISEHEESWKALGALLSRTKHLVNLAVSCGACSEILFQTLGIRECYETIQCLHLWGALGRSCVPCFEMFPKNLTKLKLQSSHLEEDPMPILERLQCLAKLLLGYSSYEGKKLTCSAGGFPSLHKLELRDLLFLCELEIKEGAMPVLSQLAIVDCPRLSLFPELQNVPSLRELTVGGHLPKLQTRLQSEDLYKINHIPSVRITDPFVGKAL